MQAFYLTCIHARDWLGVGRDRRETEAHALSPGKPQHREAASTRDSCCHQWDPRQFMEMNFSTCLNTGNM